jgi:HEAT repeat protein
LRGSLRICRDKLNEITAVQATDGGGRYFVKGRAALADTTGIDLFVKQLHAAQPSARRDAVAALCGLGEAAANHQPAVLALLGDPDPDVRAAVALKAGLLGWNPALVAAMAGAIKDPSAEVRRAAAAALGEHDDREAVAALRTAIQDPDVRVRAEVLRSLAGCGSAGTWAGSEVVASTRDREIMVRIAALDAVRRLALTTPRAVSECIRCLGDVRPEVVVAALQAVAAQGRAAGPAMPTLLRLVHHDHAPVRSAALEAAIAVAEDRQRGAAVLLCIEALTDGTREVRDAAELQLQRFVYGQPGPVPLPPMTRVPR